MRTTTASNATNICMTIAEKVEAVRSCEENHGGEVTAKQLSYWIDCSVRFARTVLQVVEGVRIGQEQHRGKTEFDKAVHEIQDAWVPAGGGTERPYRSRQGRRVLYVFNPRRMQHAYLCLDNDTILESFNPLED